MARRIAINEISSRVTTIETKAGSIGRWSTARIGFLLFRQPKGWLGIVAVAVATLAAFAAFWGATEAAKGRPWKWPGEDGWFYEKHFTATDKLRTVHVIALLEAYQDAGGISAEKGKACCTHRHC